MHEPPSQLHRSGPNPSTPSRGKVRSNSVPPRAFPLDVLQPGRSRSVPAGRVASHSLRIAAQELLLLLLRNTCREYSFRTHSPLLATLPPCLLLLASQQKQEVRGTSGCAIITSQEEICSPACPALPVCASYLLASAVGQAQHGRCSSISTRQAGGRRRAFCQHFVRWASPSLGEYLPSPFTRGVHGIFTGFAAVQ